MPAPSEPGLTVAAGKAALCDAGGRCPCFPPSCVPCPARRLDTAAPHPPGRRGDQPSTSHSIACAKRTSRRWRGRPLTANDAFLTWRRVLSLIQCLLLPRGRRGHPVDSTKRGARASGTRRRGALELTWAPGHTRVTGKLLV